MHLKYTALKWQNTVLPDGKKSVKVLNFTNFHCFLGIEPNPSATGHIILYKPLLSHVGQYSINIQGAGDAYKFVKDGQSNSAKKILSFLQA